MKTLLLVLIILLGCGPTPPTPTADDYAMARVALAALCAALPSDPLGWRVWAAAACRIAFPSHPAAPAAAD